MENKQNKSPAVAIALAVLILVSFLLLTGVNAVTAPIIEQNGASQQFALLYNVMPEAKGFDQIVGGDNSQLSDVPETVKAVYAETNGAGYVLLLSTTQGYTHDPIEFTLAVDGEGKISGVELTNYPETRDFGEDYPLTYLGQDSALAEVNLVAGVTFSSSAFKNAVADGLGLLIENGLIAEGVKGDAQILEELLPSVYPGMANLSGILQAEEQEAGEGYSYIQKILRSNNDAGYAYLVSDGEHSYLALCNLSGGVKLYDTEGKDVTDEASLAVLKAEAQMHAAANLTAVTEPPRKLASMLPEGAAVTPVPLEDVFNSVTAAFLVEADGVSTYAFVARSYGYANEVMEVYFVLDASGAIVSMNADALIFHGEYFSNYQLEESSYKAGFQGLTQGAWNGDEALISGATYSTEGVSVATTDVFEAYAALPALPAPAEAAAPEDAAEEEAAESDADPEENNEEGGESHE